MLRQRRYHPLAADDLAAAVAYYDGLSVELGNRFRAAVRKRLDSLTARPDSFGRVHKNLRAEMVHGFPYVVLFEHKVDLVSILGVFHAASDPQGWLTRSDTRH